MTAETMTRADRETLIKIARQRERVAKSEAKSRAALLLAQFEEQVDQRHRFDSNEVWQKAHAAAKEAEATARQLIADECERLGIPKPFRPSISLDWMDRGRNAFKDERAEMRRVAMRQIEAAQKTAQAAIERQSVEVQERIMVAGLTTDDARLMLESMPSAESLMPALTVDSVTALIASEKRQ